MRSRLSRPLPRLLNLLQYSKTAGTQFGGICPSCYGRNEGLRARETCMAIQTSNLSRLALAAAAGISCLFINENVSFTNQFGPLAYADARTANPPVPGSVAGAAHRTR